MGFLKKLLGRESEHQTTELLSAEPSADSRNASVGEIGGPPPDDPFASCYGGHGVALPSEPVPEYEGQPMFPLLQVNCAELPYVPDELKGVALMVLWASDASINAISYEAFGDGIVVREYATLDGLEPVMDVNTPRGLRPAGVRWALAGDAPYQMNSRDNSGNHRQTKIGGWPTTPSYTLEESGAKGTYVFQISLKRMAGYDWIEDFDFAHFLKSEAGEWQWDCQC